VATHQVVCMDHEHEATGGPVEISIHKGTRRSAPAGVTLPVVNPISLPFSSPAQKTESLFPTYQKFEIEHFLPHIGTITHRDNRENSPLLSECADMASPTAASQSQQTKKLFPPRTRRACDQCRLARCRCDGNRPWYVRRPSSL
jgi:hypothetical protein